MKRFTKATSRLTPGEQLNFLLTNRLPRRWLTLFMGRFSRIQSPRLTALSISVWQRFADDLRLQDARTPHFRSLQERFTRQLKPGLRPTDARPDIVTSPCDAIVGACGRIAGNQLFQAKGFPYTLEELIPDADLASKYRNGHFVTLRLKSSMYHRFHAPVDCRVHRVSYVSGDTWNVNPVALKQVEKLFCNNERAVVELESGHPAFSLTLVPVAAILVASMKFHSVPAFAQCQLFSRQLCSGVFPSGCSFHDIKIYQKAPYYLLKGEMYDNMDDWYDDRSLRNEL